MKHTLATVYPDDLLRDPSERDLEKAVNWDQLDLIHRTILGLDSLALMVHSLTNTMTREDFLTLDRKLKDFRIKYLGSHPYGTLTRRVLESDPDRFSRTTESAVIKVCRPLWTPKGEVNG